MCMAESFKMFFLGGLRTFRSAAKGNYDGESEAVGAIRREMFSQPGGQRGDVINMHRDRRMVGRDARVSFEKIVMGHG